MNRRIGFVLGLLFFVPLAVAEDKNKEVVAKLQESSFTIGANGGTGSGVVITRDGINFVWTAAHVVESLRKTREVIDGSSGTKRIVVEFDDAKIIKTLIEDGRKVGELQFDAKVIRYSDADNGEDLALLMIRKKNFVNINTEFYSKETPPSLGTDLWHVGSLLGQMGANSLTSGIISQHGRLFKNKVYDQTTVTAFPGSSGGGVFTKDGKYVGMLVRGAGEQFNLIVPVRRMHTWAKKAGVEWALDASVKMPTAEELEKMPVEDIGVNFVYKAAVANKQNENDEGEEKSFKFRIGPPLKNIFEIK